ncbi:MAG: phosphatidate cytidylyltransferase [Phycisphaeraceae bacterium]
MLRHRLILGPIMIVGLVVVLYVDSVLERVDISGTWLQTILGGQTHLPPGLGILALSLVLIVPAGREFGAILRANGVAIGGAGVVVAAVIGLLLIYMIPAGLDVTTALAVYATGFGAVFAMALLMHSRRREPDGAAAAGGAALLAMVYLGVLPSFYLAMRFEHAVWVIAAAIGVTKFCDIGAYFTGRAIGRHKLIPWLSPGKTWEGLVGGMVAAGIVGAVLAAAGNASGLVGQWVSVDGAREFRAVAYPVGLAAVAGMVLGGVGQLGDLVESLFKRDAGVKDSGRAVPGFGGVLDVVDSPIIVAPVAFWLLRWMGDGGVTG